jgi:hydroxyacylglutathione hydrolase
MNLEFKTFPCLSDNIGILLHGGGVTIAVDVPESGPYLRILNEKGWELTHILLTHKHHDHIAGVLDLKRDSHARVYGPKEISESWVDTVVSPGDRLFLSGKGLSSGYAFCVMGAPGHTLGHIVYRYKAQQWLFVGDVLFALGCGRLFEGTAAQMWRALEQIRSLPGETLVFCGHEYTLKNAAFALSLDPSNKIIQKRVQRVKLDHEKGSMSVPFLLAEEKQTNPFLRISDKLFQKMVFSESDLEKSKTEKDLFSQLRRWRDCF